MLLGLLVARSGGLIRAAAQGGIRKGQSAKNYKMKQTGSHLTEYVWYKCSGFQLTLGKTFLNLYIRS